MITWCERVLLALLKVPLQPPPPAGATGSVRVFRAAPNFYRLKLLRWGATQFAALLGVVLFFNLEPRLFREASEHLPPVGPFKQHKARIASWVERGMQIIEVFTLIGLVTQLPVSFFLVRLNYRMRWYIVTDRSLRIRHGLQSVREMTIGFANIQQITIRQGPLQRLLDIADLQVNTAGGGGHNQKGADDEPHESESLHAARFEGVDNAEEIRDLMLAHLRHLRDAGLGDPDEAIVAESADRAGTVGDAAVLAAAREVLATCRELREVVSARR